MIRASALQLAIVVALVIAVICSSLIALAYFFRVQAQTTDRYRVLRINAASGVNMVLNNNDSTLARGKLTDLFGNQTDSAFLKKTTWGLWDVGAVKSFIQKDSVYRVFSI